MISAWTSYAWNVLHVFTFLVDDAPFNVVFRAQDSLVTLMVFLVVIPI